MPIPATPSWQKVSTTELLKHPRVPVVEDVVTLPDGQSSVYTRILTPDAVTVIVQRADGAFLLNLEYRYPTDETIHRPDDTAPHNGWLLHFPGGSIDNDETPEAACDREVREETGVILGDAPKQLLGKVFNYFPRMTSRDYKYFVQLPATFRTAATQHDVGEQGIKQIWLKANDITELIINNDQRVMHSHFLDCWALYIANT